ncbi:MAG: hypothetical protein B7X00_00145 [Legionella sp. 21-45-4]|nr:MAG: hypothetical protein B7X00_00145 [Legionella sp. 21-45-4]
MADTGRKPSTTSYLVDDKGQFMRAQRMDEQAGKRQLARVNAADHTHDFDKPQRNLGEGLENNGPENDIPQHPYLDKQLFDGADKHLNIDPTNNPNAKMELENAEREQQEELRLRLGLQLQPGKRPPTPSPG